MPVKRSRNIERFPDDSMFQLNGAEFTNLRSQIVTSSWCGLRRAAPYAFVEQGVAMLQRFVQRPRRPRLHRDHACLCPAKVTNGDLKCQARTTSIR